MRTIHGGSATVFLFADVAIDRPNYCTDHNPHVILMQSHWKGYGSEAFVLELVAESLKVLSWCKNLITPKRSLEILLLYVIIFWLVTMFKSQGVSTQWFLDSAYREWSRIPYSFLTYFSFFLCSNKRISWFIVYFANWKAEKRVKFH